MCELSKNSLKLLVYSLLGPGDCRVPDEGVEALAKMVQDAAAARQPIYPVGGGTQTHRLADITEPGIVISTSNITQLIDYPHEDMTITVQAGMTFANLQRELARHHQSLPIDVPNPERATVGGSMAANISGPRKLGHGSWRDYVLGISWINDQGQLAKAGGRVVKNVAGYDFCKLFCGSLGTLGIITQVTMKVKPLAEKRMMVQSVAPDIAGLCNKLQLLPIRPTAVTLRQKKGQQVQLVIMLEDNAAAVNWSIEQIKQSGLTSGIEEYDGVAADMQLKRLLDEQESANSIVARVQLSRTKCDSFLTSIQKQLQLMPSWSVEPMLGVFHCVLPGEDPTSIQVLSTLKQQSHDHDGLMTIPRLPNGLRSTLQPWGEPRGDWELMRKVKLALDPLQIFQRHRHEILR